MTPVIHVCVCLSPGLGLQVYATMPGFCLYVVPGTERRSSCSQTKQYTGWLPQAITLVFLHTAPYLFRAQAGYRILTNVWPSLLQIKLHKLFNKWWVSSVRKWALGKERKSVVFQNMSNGFLVMPVGSVTLSSGIVLPGDAPAFGR